MDLVGNSTPQVDKLKLVLKPVDRYDAMISYLQRSPGVRDVVVSGGDVANVPWKQLEVVPDAPAGDRQHPRHPARHEGALRRCRSTGSHGDVVEGLGRVATRARSQGVNLAIHTHVNHANSVTPLVAKAARTALEVGVRDVRNQGVLMRGVNATTTDLLDLCFALQGEASILPYYFYMCDMIPNAEHWRVSVAHAQMLQHDMMGYLPGYATPRIICDVPFVGKRWVHMLNEYDTERGISYWTKNYRTSIEMNDAEALSRRFEFYDPIDTLPKTGQDWWRKKLAAEAAV